MRYLTERHKARAEALQRQTRARQELMASAEGAEAEFWEAELIAAGRTLRGLDDVPDELECVCGTKNPVSYTIYHIDAVTRFKDSETSHEIVNLHRLECEQCSRISETYHARR